MLVSMRMSAPQQPTNTPIAFLPVIGSFKMSAANSMANIGIEVVTMLALIGDVRLRPMVKQHWLQTKPKTAAPMNQKTSWRGTFSFLTKKDVIQNRMAPPNTRNDTMSTPVIPLDIASLPMGAISPHIAQAVNILRCAKRGTLLELWVCFLSLY